MVNMTNAFWREVMDHLPGIFLLFRIDEKEEAHLIFANGSIRDSLGYTPEEFVLASESADSVVAKGAGELIEKIATLSHGKDRDREHGRHGAEESIQNRIKQAGSKNSGGIREATICRFYSKRAVEYFFSFKFRIFSVKSASFPFIAVSLQPIDDEAGTLKEKVTKPSGPAFFAAESPLMKKIINKVDTLPGQCGHVLFRGDSGTGKRTIARQVLRGEALSGILCLEWNLPELKTAGQNEVVERLCKNSVQTGFSTGKTEKLTLLIIEICKLSSPNQLRLLEWIQDQSAGKKQIRILATTGDHLEEQVQKGNFSADLYYYLGFDTVLLPPLSRRKEDILRLVNTWLPEAAGMLGLGSIEVDDQVTDQLLHYNWPGNYNEFFRVMRESLLKWHPGQRLSRLVMNESLASPATGGPDNRVETGTGEIVHFDEMNRRYLEKVLKATEGKIYGRDGAAHLLGMKPTTLQSKLKKLGVR